MPAVSRCNDLSRLAVSALAQGFPALRFPAPLEAVYQDAMAHRRSKVLTRGLACCFPLFLLFFVADHEMLPDQMERAIVLRLWVFLPVVLLGLAVLLKTRSPMRREWVLAGLGVVSCLISVGLCVSSHSALRAQYLATLDPIVIYTVLLGRFWPMLAMCGVILSLYWAAVIHMGLLFTDIAIGNGLLLQANISFILYGCYLLERSARYAFLEAWQEQDMDADLQQTTDQLARMAHEDALTGLANRLRFTEYLHSAFEQARRKGAAIALVMIDVDHFKAYNDRYGHPAGDDCLRAVAQTLSANVQLEGALLARWGGEEFALILPQCDVAQARAQADSLVMAMRARQISHEASPVDAHVTLSCGIAVWRPQAGEAVAKLVAAADEALYHAKSRGRNRSTLYELGATPQWRSDAFASHTVVQAS